MPAEVRVHARGWNAVACLTAAAVAVAPAACRTAPPPPSRFIRLESTAQSLRLANGLRVMAVEDHATNLVEVGVRLDVGSASDPIGKGGLAHLVEHLMFQVASAPEGRPIGAALSAVAIGFNARTTWEATQYVSVARADQLERLVELEAHRFAASCATIDPGTFAREREVVKNELRQRRRPSGDDLEVLLRQVVPPDHPYARSVGGTDLEVSGLTLADVCAFMDAHYRPDRMVLVVTGDISASQAIRAAARHLGALTGHSTGPPPAYPAFAPGRRRFRGDILAGGAAVLVAWPMP